MYVHIRVRSFRKQLMVKFLFFPLNLSVFYLLIAILKPLMTKLTPSFFVLSIYFMVSICNIYWSFLFSFLTIKIKFSFLFLMDDLEITPLSVF